ncbi:MAG: carboxypeptidase regulatory-like domain-containing protein [Acidobacteriota bacterium]
MTQTLRHLRRMAAGVIVLVLAIGGSPGFAASEAFGQVTFGGLPVPGAAVTATLGDRKISTVTDGQGIYRLPDPADGAWTIRVEMLGFSPLTQEVTIAAGAPSPVLALKVLPFDEITRGLPVAAVQPAPPIPAAASGRNASSTPGGPARGTAGPPGRGFQRAGVTASAGAPPAAVDARPPAEEPGTDVAQGAVAGLLVNGSVNNGAASPFAQLAAFGNNRRGVRSLYNFGVAAILDNSAWDSRPFSFSSQRTDKPSYNDVQIAGTFGGPLRIPRILRNGPNLTISYQRTSDHTANTVPALMPTALERGGDFSLTRDVSGRPVQIIDPSNGAPFPGNVIPVDRISPQAAALLRYYPLPNLDAAGGYNYQTPVVTAVRQDSLQMRLTQPAFGRNQLSGTFGYQRTTTDTTNVFAFADSSATSGLDTSVNFSRRFSQFLSLRLRYQFTSLSTDAVPYFANRTNVSRDAGIAGNDQDPANWGPPSLNFSSGLPALTDGQYASNRSLTNAYNAEIFWSRGRHAVTFGGDYRRQQFNVLSQQDARGAFTFTGSATGSDLADFLLGSPHASSIAFGNADKYLRAAGAAAYIDDDWRLSPGLSLKLGLRWEHEAPITERFGRLVNLDVAPGFTAALPVVATDPVGAVTGMRYPDSLMRADWRGVQPRLGAAWRPLPGSSLVVRAGYGVYRNTNVYQPIAMLLAQQPPLSKTSSVENGVAHPITLANGFIAIPGATANTFAVDPDFRVGYAQNWQASVQRDLPASLTVLATYLGTKGSHLMQEFLPNTHPAGAADPCPTCPAGFVYLTSNGRSTRHAGQVQVRRRLRNGLTATVQYQLTTASDDAGAFAGVSLNGAAIAQDWQDLGAEWGPSSFDQRHQITTQFQYTSGVGIGGGTLLGGLKGTLLKGWTVTAALNAGSGLPLSPVYFTSVSGTGVTGTLRPDVNAAIDPVSSGFYLNPAAFTAPAAGRWGNAGRNSITGPAQFGLNTGLARTFSLGPRLNLDWRIDATNVLNRVTYAGVNTLFGSPQFGLANRANAMRKAQSSLRLRF